VKVLQRNEAAMSDHEGRAEHLRECKRCALEYLDEGDVMNAVTSMLSDLDKHPGTRLGPGSVLVQLGMLTIIDRDEEGARRFIEGFN
jgi:hypothetical protein